jgi:hypothetical protein
MSKLRLRRVPRIVWVLAGVVVVYLASEYIFAAATRSVGLLSPGGVPNYSVIVLGAVYVALRVTVRLVVPGAIVFLVVQSLASHLASPSKSQGS